jgi:membrane fusion protein (multidrug efflux system)
MTPSSDPTATFVAKILVILAYSCSTAAVVVGIAGCDATAQPQRTPPPPSVTVVESRRMTVPVVVNPIGTTRALHDVTIRARVKGFLLEKHFDDGKNVKKDQLLLVIDEKPFQVQLRQMEAQLAAAEASLKKAIASKTAQVSKAKLALDEAQLRLDELEERRERSLLARNAASQDDFDRAQAQRKKSAAQVDSDKASLEQSLADYDIDIASAKADVARAQSAVDDATINLGYCRMFAPIDGRIGELKVKVGNLVGDSGQTELVTIQQLDPMGLDIYPPARNLPIATALQEKTGGVTFAFAVEGERPHPHQGKTIFIDNQVEKTTSTFLVRARVPNPDGSILPGQYIKAAVTIGEDVDAVVVPEQAVMEGQEGSRVFAVDAENKVQVVKVRAVDTYQGLRVLESGLEAGQKVIVAGIQLVRPGQTVNPVEARLEQFERSAPPSYNADPRFSSQVYRIPGIDPQPKKTAPEAKKTDSGSPKTAPDPAAKPAEKSGAEPEKKAG